MADITIPREALEAARIAWLESASDYTRLDESIRAACLAMLKAWPMADIYDDEAGVYYHLPLPQESGNE